MSWNGKEYGNDGLRFRVSGLGFIEVAQGWVADLGRVFGGYVAKVWPKFGRFLAESLVFFCRASGERGRVPTESWGLR